MRCLWSRSPRPDPVNRCWDAARLGRWSRLERRATGSPSCFRPVPNRDRRTRFWTARLRRPTSRTPAPSPLANRLVNGRLILRQASRACGRRVRPDGPPPTRSRRGALGRTRKRPRSWRGALMRRSRGRAVGVKPLSHACCPNRRPRRPARPNSKRNDHARSPGRFASCPSRLISRNLLVRNASDRTWSERKWLERTLPRSPRRPSLLRRARSLASSPKTRRHRTRLRVIGLQRPARFRSATCARMPGRSLERNRPHSANRSGCGCSTWLGRRTKPSAGATGSKRCGCGRWRPGSTRRSLGYGRTISPNPGNAWLL